MSTHDTTLTPLPADVTLFGSSLAARAVHGLEGETRVPGRPSDEQLRFSRNSD